MLGGIAIIVVVLLIPVAVLMSGAAASAVIGEVFYRDGKKDAHPELVDLPD
ncbi:MAG: hypothetical protein HOJ85_09060 [Ilumatobacter sp.]|jgi:hypothetical protein|uniref:hypothetical protein n=1 Tax=Ilumatobacter sp. TaxID=1967498 RepID=UPI001D5A61AE|nr:hypothetical protein [Ilumatobacter sp.]MBT5276537.1 hypothetical protein [Ilumatobacter sp.]MBT5553899.1 hypothetical protein [Ilumatobacter sp.]MBT5865575.1 hypothetical protein [Ilumatobacter sp.]MBT7428199.1 hypothetical protein [Ilumatobacter sp.]